MYKPLLIDIARPSGQKRALPYTISLVLLGSALLGLSAQLSVRLPFSPVPITGQTLVVLVLGMLLGSRRGSACVLTYLGEGMLGLPVFASGMGGWPVLLGPTGGYLIGFVIAAFAVGWLAERGWDRRFGTSALVMIAGNAIIYAFGLVWLSRFVGAGNAVAAGIAPFLSGDLVKIAVGALALPFGWKFLGRDI